jgi:excinuclease ABC subunit C
VKLEKLNKKIPDEPGVYFFIGKEKKILYIGKATSLRSRVRSYFAGDLAEKRSELIANMVEEAKDVRWQTADSVLEALILEANLIRKHLPPANTALKDQRSWNFVAITKEEFPQVLVTRERVLSFQAEEQNYQAMFGPFPSGSELREAMKIVRRIFPYRDAKCIPAKDQKPLPRPCFNRQIGLCPGVCTGEVTAEEYKETIKNIKLFFSGKSKFLNKELKNQMQEAAEKREFEKASHIKYQIEALKHINDIALIKRDRIEQAGKAAFRIEAYDISHISGTSMVGVMTVLEDGEVKKSDYRKFHIRGQRGADDTKALREMLRRRLKHNEWPYPDLLAVDGGNSQVNAAKLELFDSGLKIPVVGVVKDERHRPKEILNLNSKFQLQEKSILLANSEAHRFAIKFHRQKSGIIHRLSR